MNLTAGQNHFYLEKVEYFTLNFGTTNDEFSDTKYLQNETIKKQTMKHWSVWLAKTQVTKTFTFTQKDAQVTI